MKRTIILSVWCIFLTTSVLAQSQQERNKKLAERFLIASIETDLNVFAEICDKNIKGYMNGNPWFDYDGLIEIVKAKKGTGEKVDIEEMVAEENEVAVKWTAYWESGVYKGMVYGVIEKDRIIEWWAYTQKWGENMDPHQD